MCFVCLSIEDEILKTHQKREKINLKIDQTLNCPEDRRVCLNVVAGVVVFFLFVENFAPDPRNDEFAQVFVVM